MTLSEWFGEWYRARRFAAEKAEGRVEGWAAGRAEARAEAIKVLRARGFYAAAAALEALDQEQDATRKPPGER